MSTPRRRPIPTRYRRYALTPADCGTPTPVDHYNTLVAELARYRAEAVNSDTHSAQNANEQAAWKRYSFATSQSLEQQVNDLRSAYFTNLAMPTAPNTNPKVEQAMSTMTNELFAAAERTLHASGSKPKDAAAVVAKLESEHGVVCTVEGGLLTMTQNGAPASVGTILSAFKAKNPRDFYGEAVRSILRMI